MRRIKLLLAANVMVFGLAGFSAAPALASSTPRWDVYYYNPSGQALYQQPAGTSASFPLQEGSAYVTRMTSGDKSLTGDRLGGTVTATVEVTGLTGGWTYNGDGSSWNPCGTPASVRLFFSSYSSAAGTPQPPAQAGGSGYPGVVFTKYWWSNPESVTMDQISGSQYQLTAVLTPAAWSDWNGQVGSSVPDAFNAAASHVASIGVSFGGGCFFENGVTSTDGSGQFQLSGFSD